MGAHGSSSSSTQRCLNSPRMWGLVHFGDKVLRDPWASGSAFPSHAGTRGARACSSRGAKRILRDDDLEALLMGCVILIPIIGGL